METMISLESLPIFEALASETRIRIINLLSTQNANIKEISEKLSLSNPIITRHVQQLEKVNIIRTELVPAKRGKQKICILNIEELYVRFPKNMFPEYLSYETSIQIGLYTDFNVLPSCGLASSTDIIGQYDDPKQFMNPERVKADLLWFSQGFVEYKIPNYLNKTQNVEAIEIQFEIASEFPSSNNNWPSDITFYINYLNIGTWTIPGNFADVRGKNNPNWWPRAHSQYGLLKTLRINHNDTSINGEKISDLNLSHIDFDKELITLRFSIEKDSENVGGLTIFGKNFGNYSEDIKFKLYYSEKE